MKILTIDSKTASGGGEAAEPVPGVADTPGEHMPGITSVPRTRRDAGIESGGT